MNLNNSVLGYSLIGIALFGFTTAVRADQAILRYGGDGYGPKQIVDPNLAFFSDANIYGNVDVATAEIKVSAYSDSVPNLTNQIFHYSQGSLPYQDLTYVGPSGLVTLELVLSGQISRSAPTASGWFQNSSVFNLSAAFVGINYSDSASLRWDYTEVYDGGGTLQTTNFDIAPLTAGSGATSVRTGDTSALDASLYLSANLISGQKIDLNLSSEARALGANGMWAFTDLTHTAKLYAITPTGGSLTTAGGFVIPVSPTAVPLPATWILYLLGLLVCGAAGRRQKA
jgi:hypothetical protein